MGKRKGWTFGFLLFEAGGAKQKLGGLAGRCQKKRTPWELEKDAGWVHKGRSKQTMWATKKMGGSGGVVGKKKGPRRGNRKYFGGGHMGFPKARKSPLKKTGRKGPHWYVLGRMDPWVNRKK